MFCKKCGKEIEDIWVKCPYCGTKVNASDTDKEEVKSESAPEPYDLENVKREETEDKSYADSKPVEVGKREERNVSSIGHNKRKISRRSFWKYFFLSIITCGIYGIYVLYGFVNDVNDICEGDGKKSPNYIKVLLLGLVTCGIYSIYWWYKQANRIQEAGAKYGVQIRENGTTILVWEILGVTVMPGIGFMVATYIMFDNVNRIALGYNGEKSPEELQQMPKPHPQLVRNVLITYAVIVVLYIVLIGSLFAWFLKSMSDDENYYDDSDENEVVQEEIKDFSNLDMETFVGASVEDVEMAGFVVNTETMEVDEEGVYIIFDENQKVYGIGIEGDVDTAPSFHGVTLGMERSQVIEKLSDAYPILQEGEDDLSVYNLDTRGTVYCMFEEELVVWIAYGILTDDEVAEINEEFIKNEYIFPDSDKKYLSEDEVRSVEADKLRIGRNEIFARHGVIFKSEDLQTYFSGCSWYEGTVSVDSFNAEATFNDFEKKNVELIKRVEDEVNGANAVANFIGIEGAYQCGSMGDSGVVTVLMISDGIVYMQIGTNNYPDMLRKIEARITDNHTAVWEGVTFTWTDVGVLQVSGDDVGDLYDILMEGVDYVVASYYGAS